MDTILTGIFFEGKTTIKLYFFYLAENWINLIEVNLQFFFLTNKKRIKYSSWTESETGKPKVDTMKVSTKSLLPNEN